MFLTTTFAKKIETSKSTQNLSYPVQYSRLAKDSILDLYMWLNREICAIFEVKKCRASSVIVDLCHLW